MISSKGLFYHDEKTKLLLDMKNEKRPVAVQIFGNDIETMKYASKYVSKYADIINLHLKYKIIMKKKDFPIICRIYKMNTTNKRVRNAVL